MINSFLRIDTNKDTEQGYNTDYRSVQFDEKTDSNFTRSLLLSAVPVVEIDGVRYRQFILDINEPNSANKSSINLDMLQIFLGNAGNLTNFSTTNGFGANATKVFDLDANGNNTIGLEDINSGSGRYDMFANIRDDLFTGPNQFVYLYSKFTGNNGGFEEW
ncbi:hypothetical protein WDZ92_44040, partial [Nostoc sp. NIES-2111]